MCRDCRSLLTLVQAVIENKVWDPATSTYAVDAGVMRPLLVRAEQLSEEDCGG